MTYPTVEQPLEVTGKPGHAWVFVENGCWRIEHCMAGRWHTCQRYNQQEAVARHLARKTGHGPASHGRLAGTHHGGGGFGPPYIKGPTKQRSHS